MCGICGVIDFNNGEYPEKLIDFASKSISHRGPDALVYKKIGTSFLSHSRLSVIDLNTNSDQPMTDKETSIVFNGEIYNYLELKDLLKTKYGVVFSTKSDTEVILKGYQIFGAEGISRRLRGMFSMCILDNNLKKSFLIRDRFGEKPLYYSLIGGKFFFASNVGALRRLIPELTLNHNAILELLGNQYISGEECIYNDVKKCNPGEIVECGDNSDITSKFYWKPDYSQKIEVGFEQAVEEVEDLLESAIKEQIYSSDLPVNLFLSGGIDSSLIAAIAKRFSPKIKGFTIGFGDGSLFDETEDAIAVAKAIGLESKIIAPDFSLFLNSFENVLKYIEPFGDSSIIPTMAVASEAKKDCSVVLTGDGGDELFGGYGKPKLATRKQNENLILARALNFFGDRRLNPLFAGLGGFSQSGKAFELGGVSSYFRNQDLMSGYIKKIILHSDFPRNNKPQGQAHLNVLISHLGVEKSDVILDWGIKMRLTNDYLTKVDSGTMIYGLESRAPFLDFRILEYTSKLKLQTLMPKGIDKEITKKILEKYIPHELIYKQKKGFSIPVDELFKGEWSDVLIKELNTGRSGDLKIFEPNGVKKLLNWHKSNNIPYLSRLLFSILALELWLKNNIE